MCGSPVADTAVLAAGVDAEFPAAGGTPGVIGDEVGEVVGDDVGDDVGDVVGNDVGDFVGDGVGNGVGNGEGAGVLPPPHAQQAWSAEPVRRLDPSQPAAVYDEIAPQ